MIRTLVSVRQEGDGNVKKKKNIKKVIKGLSKASKTHAAQAKTLKGVINGSKKGNRKKTKGSGRRLYTDENPRDTVKIKFATPADARATVRKVKNINKPFARKIQILNSYGAKSQSYG